MDSHQNILHDIARLFLPEKQIKKEEKCTKLFCLKNLQTDHHIGNKLYFQLLTKDWCSMLPSFVADYASLPAEQLANIVKMVCMTFVIVTAREILEESETLTGSQPSTSGFLKPEAYIHSVRVTKGFQ